MHYTLCCKHWSFTLVWSSFLPQQHTCDEDFTAFIVISAFLCLISCSRFTGLTGATLASTLLLRQDMRQWEDIGLACIPRAEHPCK